MKKKNIIVLSIVGVIVILAVIASIILFAPKRLTSLVPTENIASVSLEPRGYIQFEYGTVIELTGETKDACIKEIQNGRYKYRFVDYLLGATLLCNIQYNDGTKIVIANNGVIRFYDAEGELVKFQKIYLLADFDQFVPSE